MFLRIKINFLLVKTQLLIKKLDKAKLLIIKILFYNITKYNNLLFFACFFLFIVKVF